MQRQLTFLGATLTVTGSKYLLTVGSKRYLIECGLFQGTQEEEQRNWDALPVAPQDITAVFLSHAHLDHTGYVPRLIATGYRGKVFASEATCELLKVLWLDSGRLQEEQADYANKKGYSRHKPALPLYTEDQAKNALRSLAPTPVDQRVPIDQQVTVTMRRAGHILGSATLTIDINTNGPHRLVVFSGDLGRYNQEVMRPPAPVDHADYLIMESTYGGRA